MNVTWKAHNDKITCMEQVIQHEHWMFSVEEHYVLYQWRLAEVKYFIIVTSIPLLVPEIQLP